MRTKCDRCDAVEKRQQELEQKLAECVAVINKLIPYAEHGLPTPSHPGSCRPDSNCDMDCANAYHGAIAINNARDTLAKLKRGTDET